MDSSRVTIRTNIAIDLHQLSTAHNSGSYLPRSWACFMERPSSRYKLLPHARYRCHISVKTEPSKERALCRRLFIKYFREYEQLGYPIRSLTANITFILISIWSSPRYGNTINLFWVWHHFAFTAGFLLYIEEETRHVT